MRRNFVLSLGLILLANALLLGQSFYDRQVTDIRLPLTERELHLSQPFHFLGAKNHFSLSLDWALAPPADAPAESHYYHALRLSPEHFASFGFPTGCPAPRDTAPRRGYVTLEFNGPHYHAQVARARQARDALLAEEAAGGEQLENDIRMARDRVLALEGYESRLYIIDAAATKTSLQEALAQDSPAGDLSVQRFLLPALIKPAYSSCDTINNTQREITVTRLLVPDIAVPREYPELLSKREAPRFTAHIAFGRQGTPWLEELHLCNSDCEPRYNEGEQIE